MSYSRQSANGTVVENKDGEIYVNGRHIESGKRSASYYVSMVSAWAMFFIIGYIAGAT